VSERSTTHSTFVIERTYEASPERVFEAWSDPASKALWFGPPQKPQGAYSLDFRVGGSEHLKIPTPAGENYSFDAVYQDIVPGQRIVYTYEMFADENRISVSVATVQFRSRVVTTQLVLTEQGVFLDGHDTVVQREEGSQSLLDSLAAILNGDGP